MLSLQSLTWDIAFLGLVSIISTEKSYFLDFINFIS